MIRAKTGICQSIKLFYEKCGKEQERQKQHDASRGPSNKG